MAPDFQTEGPTVVSFRTGLTCLESRHGSPLENGVVYCWTKANRVSLNTCLKHFTARLIARPGGAQVPERGDPRGQPRMDEGKGPAAGGRRVGCGTA